MMKITLPFLSLIVSFAVFAKEAPQDLMTKYYVRTTLSESSLGSADSASIYNAFKLGDYKSFFSELESLSFQKNQEEIQADTDRNASYFYAEKIDPSLKKLHASIDIFCKKHPSSNISSILKEWSSFNFSKEEKETLSYFKSLKSKKTSGSITPLEMRLLSILSQCELMQLSFKEHENTYSSFYIDHGNYLLELYTHKKMLALLDHNFDPTVFHHIETYLNIAKKKASFFHNNNLLHDMIQGDLALQTEAEIAAKNLLKPQLKKIDYYFNQIENPT